MNYYTTCDIPLFPTFERHAKFYPTSIRARPSNVLAAAGFSPTYFVFAFHKNLLGIVRGKRYSALLESVNRRYARGRGHPVRWNDYYIALHPQDEFR